MMRAPIPDARPLIEAVLARSSTGLYGIHGSPHWRRVAATGLGLLDDEPEADPIVVFLFALFHDSRRHHDGHDPHHGERAAVLARELHGDLHHVSDEQMDLLEFALVGHDRGGTSGNATVGVSWDSDRLNLWRLGIRPKPSLLSTQAAKERIEWARGVADNRYRWEDLAEDYGLLWGASS